MGESVQETELETDEAVIQLRLKSHQEGISYNGSPSALFNSVSGRRIGSREFRLVELQSKHRDAATEVEADRL